MKKILKDLLYTKDNQALDISRLCSLFANIAYWVVVTHGIIASGEAPDLSNLGVGWAAIAGGSMAWIYARHEQARKGRSRYAPHPPTGQV